MRFLFLLAIAPMVAACVPGNNTLVANEATGSIDRQQIVDGKTTKAEILRMYGEPSARSLVDGLEIWDYHGVNMGVVMVGIIPSYGVTSTKGVQVKFDKYGVVRSHEVHQ